MSTIDQINRLTDEIKSQQKRDELAWVARKINNAIIFQVRVKELYKEIQDLHNQPLKFNGIYYYGGYDPSPPCCYTKKVNIKVRYHKSSIDIDLCGWVWSHGTIRVVAEWDSINFRIIACGFHVRFDEKVCSSVEEAKQRIIHILSNLNQF